MTAAVADQVTEAVDLESWLEDDHACEMAWVDGLVCGAPAGIRVRVRHKCGYNALRFFCLPCYEILKNGEHTCRQCKVSPASIDWEVL